MERLEGDPGRRPGPADGGRAVRRGDARSGARCAPISSRWPRTAARRRRCADAEVTVVAPDRPGLLWRSAGVLASHRLTVRSAATSVDGTAVTVFDVEPMQFGESPIRSW